MWFIYCCICIGRVCVCVCVCVCVIVVVVVLLLLLLLLLVYRMNILFNNTFSFLFFTACHSSYPNILDVGHSMLCHRGMLLTFNCNLVLLRGRPVVPALRVFIGVSVGFCPYIKKDVYI